MILFSPEQWSSGICATASYFGDQLLHLRQIYKIVDSIFETMTIISQEASDLSHDEFTKRLMKKPTVTALVATGHRRGKAVSFALSNLSNNSIACGPTASSSSTSTDEDKFEKSRPSLIESMSSNASIDTASSGQVTESSSSSDNGDKNNLPRQYQASSQLAESVGDPATSYEQWSQFSDGDTSSLNPLKPITRISIHMGGENE